MTVNYRKELRFSIPRKKVDIIIDFLVGNNFFEHSYQNTPITQTIYFNNEKFFIPFNLSLKLRNYVDFPKNTVDIDDSMDYILEKKSFIFVNNEAMKIKKRINLSGVDAKKYFNETSLSAILNEFEQTKSHFEFNEIFSDVFLKPHMATQYARRHFEKGEHLRVTLDTHLRTFMFEKEKSIETTGYDVVPVELKIDDLSAASDAEKIMHFIEKNGGQEALSKKNLGLNGIFFCRNSKLDSRYKLTKELNNNEVELKFDIYQMPPDLIFLALRNLFEKGNDGFYISEGYPFSEEIGSIHKYFSRDGNLFRIAYSGDVATITAKSRGKMTEGILDRNETKLSGIKFESLKELVSDDAELLGTVTRIRRNFWIANDQSKRVYKVAVDNSYNESRCLSQVEIEYTGILKQGLIDTRGGEIHSEMLRLKKLALDNKYLNGYIIPSSKKKLEWVLNNKKSN
jgi:hypothetical protein